MSEEVKEEDGKNRKKSQEAEIMGVPGNEQMSTSPTEDGVRKQLNDATTSAKALVSLERAAFVDTGRNISFAHMQPLKSDMNVKTNRKWRTITQLPSQVNSRCFAVEVNSHIFIASQQKDQPSLFFSTDKSHSKFTAMSPPLMASKVHAILKINGQLWLVAWPQQGKRSPLSLTLWQLTERTMSWKEMSYAPWPVWDCAIASQNSLIIFVGGLDNSGWSSSVFMFDTASKQWEMSEMNWPRLPYTLAGATAVFIGTKLVILGGITSTGPQEDILMLDLSSPERKWQISTKMPYVLAGGCCFQNQLVIAGGTERGQACHSTFRYSIEDGRWQECGDLETGRLCPVLISLHGVVFCIGGLAANEWSNFVERLE